MGIIPGTEKWLLTKYFLDKKYQKIYVPALVFTLSFILYWSTAARSPGWVDATLLLNSARKLDLGVWVNTHNLFNVMGYSWLRLFPTLDPHFALTLFSSLMGSLTVLFIYLAGVELTGNRAAAALSSAALIVSLSLWWHSTTIEVYTLNTALIGLFLFLIFRSYRTGTMKALYFAFFFGGLGISNHVLMGLYIFAFILLLFPFSDRKFQIKLRHALLLAVCYLAGAALFTTLFIIHWQKIFTNMSYGSDDFSILLLAKSLITSLKYATGGGFLKMMFTQGLTSSEKLFWRSNYIFLILLNYPSAAIVFIFSGFPGMWRLDKYRSAVLFFFAGLLAQIIWSANYFIWDMYAYTLPVYVMLAIPLTVGVDRFLQRKKSKKILLLVFATFLIPVLLYTSFSHWPNREKSVDRYISMYPESERTGGIWDPVEYIFNPVKRNYQGVEIFVNGILNILPRDAVYWDDESKAAYPLRFYYQDILKRRNDINVNTIFGLIMEEEDARNYALRMQFQINNGKSVFISALVEPEREILNQLYHMQTPDIPIDLIRSKSIDNFLSTFPVYEIIEIPIVPDGSLRIYQINKRVL
jgi:hypothetical protein